MDALNPDKHELIDKGIGLRDKGGDFVVVRSAANLDNNNIAQNQVG